MMCHLSLSHDAVRQRLAIIHDDRPEEDKDNDDSTLVMKLTGVHPP